MQALTEDVLPAAVRAVHAVTAVTEIGTKADMSRWSRAHSDVPGITWSVLAGPGGTMIIIEHEDRCSPSWREGRP
jgi:hypothetical protein